MSELTISQALRQVKKLKGDLKERLDRAKASVSHKENAIPAFPFHGSLEQADLLREKLIELQTRIAVTNALTKVDSDGTMIPLAYAVRELEELKSQIAWFKELSVRAQASTKEDELDYDPEDGKRRRISVAWTCWLPEAERAARVETLQKDFDRLNDVVEKANHATLLVRLA